MRVADIDVAEDEFCVIGRPGLGWAVTVNQEFMERRRGGVRTFVTADAAIGALWRLGVRDILVTFASDDAETVTGA